MSVDVTLTWAEVHHAANVGIMRCVSTRQRGGTGRYGFGNNSWDVDIIGALGECAVAKLTNMFWSGAIGDTSAADVGDDVQVRSSRREDGRLILHRQDSEQHRWVLVTGSEPTLAVHGWIYGVEGKQEKYWCDPGTGRPAYFVPQSALRPMGEWESK